MSFTLHQTPYGSLAIHVHADGSAYCVPASGLVTSPTSGKITPAPRAYGEEQEALVINGVRYGYFHVKPSHLGAMLDVPYFRDWSKSARAKLQQWITENYDEIATPLRVAEAQLESARDRASSAEQEFLKAQQAWQDAEREASEAYQRVADLKNYEIGYQIGAGA